MNQRDQLRSQIETRIRNYEDRFGLLSGIIKQSNRTCFIEQIVDSIHRVQYVNLIRERTMSPKRANPEFQNLFDPLLAAVYQMQQGNREEAFWLVFIFVHFGRNKQGVWQLARDFYGRLGQGGVWDWHSVSSDTASVTKWIVNNLVVLSRPGGGFGNHRKYESLNHLGKTIESYVSWVKRNNTHLDLIGYALDFTNNDPKTAFDFLYKSMSIVYRFGRTACFDYLTMLGKLGLAPIEPPKAYIAGATGPKVGGRELFGDPDLNSKELEERFAQLNNSLQYGMQVLEDAICNWQKSPGNYEKFKD
jgi:Alpha-glutamyl/putrescinyl thymine pyrophosphorylase clade 3